MTAQCPAPAENPCTAAFDGWLLRSAMIGTWRLRFDADRDASRGKSSEPARASEPNAVVRWHGPWPWMGQRGGREGLAPYIDCHREASGARRLIWSARPSPWSLSPLVRSSPFFTFITPQHVCKCSNALVALGRRGRHEARPIRGHLVDARLARRPCHCTES